MSPDVEHALRGAALRVTRPRLAVLSTVQDHPHSSSDTVLRRVRQELPGVSHQAVYDVLRALTTVGLLRRIEPSGSPALYETRVGDNHHHAICRTCGEIADVDCAIGAAPCLTPAQDHGYAIDESEVTYWGLCAICSAARSSPHPPTKHPSRTTPQTPRKGTP